MNVDSLDTNEKTHRRKVVLGDREIISLGLNHASWRDLYHRALTASWPLFLVYLAAVFVVINVVFAGLFMMGGGVANARPGSLDAFYFSVETLATVGYGAMYPASEYAHLVVTLEVFVGMVATAVMTGLVFARFSLPRARVLFSDVIIVGRHEGATTLMLRMANARLNYVNNANARLWVLLSETTAEGRKVRRFRELPLLRSENPFFVLSWTVFHVLDEASPLFERDFDALLDEKAGIAITVSGIDEETGQRINARRSYGFDQVRRDHRFVDILDTDDQGRTRLDYRKFHLVEPDDVRQPVDAA